MPVDLENERLNKMLASESPGGMVVLYREIDRLRADLARVTAEAAAMRASLQKLYNVCDKMEPGSNRPNWAIMMDAQAALASTAGAAFLRRLETAEGGS